ncbi:hypothetical protein FRB94_014224 [Tulasnella sp. JGI-2019a]|nr:hypothetical protein FRB93_005430 [Tulasnella sp. JGI-2019a]KAG9014131.1 hypothetical protein FRB94_014224 [Tulasnella sp. JGI-2019a]
MEHTPPEILAHILDLSLEAEWSVQRLQKLAQVSRFWKSVVIETPTLWGVARMNTLTGVRPSWREELELALKRSKSAPLTVDCYGLQAPPLSIEFMGMVAKHSTRWEMIKYVGGLYPEVVTALEQPTPLLQALGIDNRSAGDSKRLNIAGGLHLQDLVLLNVMLPWNTLTRLRSLIIFGINYKKKDNRPRIIDFLEVLRSSPDLEALELGEIVTIAQPTFAIVDEVSINDFIRGQTPIQLPRLVSLEAESNDGALTLALLATICADALIQLKVVVGQPFHKALSTIDPEPLFKPALRLVNQCLGGSRMGITRCSDTITFHTRLNDDFNTIPYDRDSFILQFSGVSAKNTSIVEAVIDFLLQIPNQPVPRTLQIGKLGLHRPTESISPLGLLCLDNIEDLRLYGSSSTNSSIHTFLSKPQYNPRKEGPAWPCSCLAMVWLSGSPMNWKDLATFLESRWNVEGEICRDKLPMPIPLRTVTLVEHHPPADLLSRMASAAAKVECTQEDDEQTSGFS